MPATDHPGDSLRALTRVLASAIASPAAGSSAHPTPVDATASGRSAPAELPSDLEAFVSQIEHQRVSGLVMAALEGGAFGDRTDEVLGLLTPVHLQALRTSLAAEAKSIEVADLLERAGIRSAMLKGCATAWLDYPDPAMRITGDVDVLVSRTDYARAIAALASVGLVRVAPPFRVGWERRYGKDIPMIGGAGVEVDLHLALVSGYFGVRMPTDAMLDRAVPYHVGGRSLRALGAADRLIHAAIHTASTTPVRLGSAVDVIRIPAAHHIETGYFIRRARALCCDALVAAGIARSWELFGVPPTELSEWALGHRADDRQRRAMSSFDIGTGESMWLSGLAALPPLRRPGYAVPLLLPSRAHLASRNRTFREHIRTSVRRTRAV